MDESISLRELVDADVVQAIQDSFARTVGVSSVIFLPDGDALTRFSNQIKFCTLIQSTKEGRRRCFQSFAEMSRKAVKLSEPEIMYCFAYGAHFVAPIIIDGERKATMYAGQFRPEEFSPEQLEELEKIAVEIGLDPELLVKEANNMRTVGDEVAMDCLHSFVRTVKVIAELGAQAAELRQTKDALQDAYDGLEVRVEERTAELAGANKELRREVAERRAAEEALRESEAKYRLLTETSKDAILSFDMDGRITYLNRAAIGLGGYSEEDIQQMNITDVLPEDQLSGFYERLSMRAAGGAGILLYEVDFINKAGERIPVEVNSSMITEDGKPLGILLTCRDITRRKAIEEGLKTSGSLLRSTLESTADGILVVDRAGKTIDFNKKFLEMWSIPDSLAALRDTDKLLEFARAQLTDPDAFLARVRELYARPDAEICDILELKDGRIFERYSTPHQIDGKTVGSVRSFHDITKRKRAEDALRESEEKLRSIVEQSGDGIVLVDEHGTIVEWNRGQERITGLLRTEVLGRPLWDVQFQVTANDPDNPAAHEQVKAGVLKILETGQSEWLDRLDGTVIKRPDGTHRAIQAAVFPIKTDKGFMAGAISRDVTERKKAEETMQINEEKYKALYNNAPLSYQSLNEDGSFNDVNPAWIRTLGYNKKEVIGKWFGDFLHPDWKPQFEKNFQELKRRGYVHDVQFKIRHKDGHYLDISFEGYIGYNPDGSFKQTYCVFHDITKHKQAEQSLLEAESELKHIIEVVPGMIAKVNTHTGYFTYCNPAFSSLLGFSPEEFLARPFIEFVHPDDRQGTINEVEKQIKGIPLAMFENRYSCKNGSYKWLEWRVTAADENGVIYAAATDITEREAAEEQIKRSLREKDVLMHEIHHRVKNNLQVASSLLSMQARTTTNKEAIDVLSKSQSRINTMALIHTQLYESGDLSELNMKEFVGILSEQLFRSYPVSDTKITPIIHMTDRKFPASVVLHVGLIINELLSNAIEHAFGAWKDGKIEIVLTASDSGRVNLRVSDNGVGLPPGFDIDTTKTLGLHLVKILVEDQLQGTLEVISDGGATFNMEFDIEGNGGSSYGEDKNTDR
jgi:PAS domain S-box-containing protein